MACHLCITNEENFNVIKDKKVWGVAQRHLNKIKDVSKGDILVMYEIAKQKSQNNEPKPPYIRAFYEVNSDLFEQNTKIFEPTPKNPNEKFPLRLNLKEIEVLDNPINFKDLIHDLEFIANKKAWYGSLMGRAMIPLSDKDYNVIVKNK